MLHFCVITIEYDVIIFYSLFLLTAEYRLIWGEYFWAEDLRRGNNENLFIMTLNRRNILDLCQEGNAAFPTGYAKAVKG